MKYRVVYRPETAQYEVQYRLSTGAPFQPDQWYCQTTCTDLASAMACLSSYSYGNGIQVAETANE